MTNHKPLPYMKFYPGDYLAATPTLTAEEHGAYLLVLMAMWIEGGALPDNPVVLARIARVSVRRWRSLAWALQPHFLRIDGFVTQRRLTLELDKAREAGDVQRSRARRGGMARVSQLRRARHAEGN